MTTEERGIVSSAEILILPARSLSATLGIVGGLVFRKDAAGATISFGQGNDEMNTIHSFILLHGLADHGNRRGPWNWIHLDWFLLRDTFGMLFVS